MKNVKIGFIGNGNMGSALAISAFKSGCCPELYLCDHNTDKTAALARKTGGKISDANEIAQCCKFIFLGAKPQYTQALLDEISPVLKTRKDPYILVSMAAGIRTDKIAAMSGCDSPVIRIMPNTPVSVGEGMILYCTSKNVTEDDEAVFLENLSAAGMTDKIPEDLIDAGCAVSGCGPAFMYMFARAVAKGGEKAGLSPEKAVMYAEQTMLGAAKLALNSPESLENLIRAVCSPGGSTIEGVKVLENSDFDDITLAAITAAYEKTKLLGK